MARYFAGTRSLLGLRGPGLFEWQPTVGSPARYDANYVDGAFGLAPVNTNGLGGRDSSFLQVPIAIDSATGVVAGELWGHFEHFSPGGSTGTSGNNNTQFLSFVNDAGVTTLELAANTAGAGNGPTFRLRYWNGSAFVDTALILTMPGNVRTVYDFRLVHGASGSFELWQNGSLIISQVGLNAAVNNTRFVRLHTGTITTGGFAYYSQVALSDFDMRAFNFTSNAPATVGFYAEGVGTIGNLNDMNLGTVYTLDAVDDRVTGIIAARPALPAGRAILAVQVGGPIRMAAPAGNGRAMTRIAGADYFTANFTPVPTGGFGFSAGVFEANPAGGAWTITAVNAAEFGFQARA
jgi:hypothetical protein